MVTYSTMLVTTTGAIKMLNCCFPTQLGIGFRVPISNNIHNNTDSVATSQI